MRKPAQCRPQDIKRKPMNKIALAMTLALGSPGRLDAAQAQAAQTAAVPVTCQAPVARTLRVLVGTEFRSSGASDIGDYAFKDTSSAVAELEYMATPSIGVTLRYVNDKFEEKRYGGKVKGDHVGAFANFYF